ncbi:UNVERIFIED_CONTAM: hypothetical protein PYX00_010973 [Menopon gallinae]|uniref:site-specific DNA-methyltransferase (adenine-specific) n=1 Tax=Menopon gallinae TaxID=328185 RepID=A0AAW2H6Y6_9NEOP
MGRFEREINDYINELRKNKIHLGTEHTGRGFLQALLKELSQGKFSIIHEPKRDKKGWGAPDFKISDKDLIIGYVENKKAGEDLDIILESPQVQKYQNLSDNLILTDYLNWIWLYKGKVQESVRLCEKRDLDSLKKLKISSQLCQGLEKLLCEGFFSREPEKITRAETLAYKLAKPTRYIRDELESYLLQDISDKNPDSRLIALLRTFRDNISESISEADFGDAFAQTLSYSLFLTKINLKDSQQTLNLNNIQSLTPSSFALLKDILIFISTLNEYKSIEPWVETILNIINYTDTDKIQEDLRFSSDKEKDPYLYFYEDFLKFYDPNKRVDAGVYYTPAPVVEAIVRNLQDLIIQDFNFKEGLANENVKILDFSCGTGTFLFEIYKLIFSQASAQGDLRKSKIQRHILKNIYGFELLIPAYCVAHLKLSGFLKEEASYSLEPKERIPVYLTNTLEIKEGQNTFLNILPALSKEGREAQAIKQNNEILVITGNPPYSGESNNKGSYIEDLIKPYFPNLKPKLVKYLVESKKTLGISIEEFLFDDIKEKNPKWLNDDYVKFIRFAENKISKAGRGQELIDAHLLKEKSIPDGLMGLPSSQKEHDFKVEKIQYDSQLKRLYYNESGFFSEVSPEVWQFKIGGYQKVIKVLDFTVQTMQRIDKTLLRSK